ncbi:hypothetical protein [Pectobacterium brasiliense]|uniref:hypothetical protein n=1 Tax=Pectobacterium brasiliense TaxID=180957 RepID=UPI0005829DA6|nr:hypothetical protein [Pectobacterium brasiliense]KHT18288.1 hypothetical protein RC97_11765 [Pectobacterium brasiliense]
MKKIKAKHLIALLRKYRILKYWKTKPYLCITMAVLSLLILFLLLKVPDTVSAIADIFMAGAAIFAAYHAKDWLQPKIDEDTYKIAKNIIIENYTTAFTLMCEQQELTFSYSYHYNDFNDPYAKKDIFSIIENKKKLNEKSIVIDNIDKNVILLKKIGYTFKGDLGNEHDNLMKLFDGFFNECNVLWIKCIKKENIKESQKLDINELHNINLEIIAAYNYLNNRFNLIIEKYNSFIVNDMNVMDYFKKIK